MGIPENTVLMPSNYRNSPNSQLMIGLVGWRHENAKIYHIY